MIEDEVAFSHEENHDENHKLMKEIVDRQLKKHVVAEEKEYLAHGDSQRNHKEEENIQS